MAQRVLHWVNCTKVWLRLLCRIVAAGHAVITRSSRSQSRQSALADSRTRCPSTERPDLRAPQCLNSGVGHRALEVPLTERARWRPASRIRPVMIQAASKLEVSGRCEGVALAHVKQ